LHFFIGQISSGPTAVLRQAEPLSPWSGSRHLRHRWCRRTSDSLSSTGVFWKAAQFLSWCLGCWHLATQHPQGPSDAADGAAAVASVVVSAPCFNLALRFKVAPSACPLLRPLVFLRASFFAAGLWLLPVSAALLVLTSGQGPPCPRGGAVEWATCHLTHDSLSAMNSLNTLPISRRLACSSRVLAHEWAVLTPLR
jgi:hypothetical protein